MDDLDYLDYVVVNGKKMSWEEAWDWIKSLIQEALSEFLSDMDWKEKREICESGEIPDWIYDAVLEENADAFDDCECEYWDDMDDFFDELFELFDSLDRLESLMDDYNYWFEDMDHLEDMLDFIDDIYDDIDDLFSEWADYFDTELDDFMEEVMDLMRDMEDDFEQEYQEWVESLEDSDVDWLEDFSLDDDDDMEDVTVTYGGNGGQNPPAPRSLITTPGGLSDAGDAGSTNILGAAAKFLQSASKLLAAQEKVDAIENKRSELLAQLF